MALARAVQRNLNRLGKVQAVVWNQGGVFGLSEFVLESLLRELDQAAFGVFILAAADTAIVRSKVHRVPRDNVIFEVGLFAGRLGRKQTFLVVPRDTKPVKLPSDLQGLVVGMYDPKTRAGGRTAALKPVCREILKAVAERQNLVIGRQSGVVQTAAFSTLLPEFNSMIDSAQKMTLFFIHSRRWRQNQGAAVERFLKRRGTRMEVFLPDLREQALFAEFKAHFVDGPRIPGLVVDAYEYFRSLSIRHPGRMHLWLFRRYPTYSFYQFDQSGVVALYPNTATWKDVPAFVIRRNGMVGDFLTADIKDLKRECRKCSTLQLERLIASSALK